MGHRRIESGAPNWWLAIVFALTAVGCGGDPFTSCEGAECGAESASAGTQGGAPASVDATSSTATAGGDGEGGGPQGTAGSGGSDPGCDGSCVPSVPEGWNGPVSLYVGTDPPSCGTLPTTLEAHSGSLVAPASCSACQCGAPSGGSCGLPVVNFYDPTSCGGSAAQVVTAGGGACKNIVVSFPNGDFAESLKFSAPIQTPGTCASSGGALEAQPAVWGQSARACALTPTGTCGAGMTCVPLAPEPFPARVCILTSASADCPAAFPEKISLYAGVADSRSCTACNCGPGNTVCGGTLTLYNASSCGGTAFALSQADSCSSGVYGSMKWSGSTTPGGCTPYGGQLQGSVAPAAETTVCCVGAD